GGPDALAHRQAASGECRRAEERESDRQCDSPPAGSGPAHPEPSYRRERHLAGPSPPAVPGSVFRPHLPSGTIACPMRTHPVFLRLEGRPCVVVGGDAQAAAKVAACVRAGAEVTVIARMLGPELAALIGPGVRHVARDYRSGDLAGAFLAYAS